ncbi:undecaprenyl-phosphate glucose phosphotransferase [Rhodopseudomonas palustris]|uniref:Undecaprenyl-phosphate glucose phosphotransferase n=1 Tax=Rhodopseudomonas palustris TaxID=1076 RepID=A0A418VQZ2_RHOPL|nr:undecaprenyl-phosphate glucose phosphotransferase [Rhodopseudomonas palustris]RJF78749.1 undecaprenyl-phosphate glucose phosphotransferase [Rhodopseudomonas palustris]
MNSARRRFQFETAPSSGLANSPTQDRKWPVQYDSVELLAVLADFATIFTASLVAAFAHKLVFGAPQDISRLTGVALPMSVVFAAVFKSCNMYSPTALLNLRNQIRAVCAIWLGVFILFVATTYALHMEQDIRWDTALTFGAVGLVSLIAQRALLRDALRKGLSERRFSGRKIVLITDEHGQHLVNMLSDLGFFVEKHFTLPVFHSSQRRQEKLIEMIIDHTRETEVREIFFGVSLNHWSRLKRVVGALHVLPLRVRLVPTGASSELFCRPSTELGGARCVELHRGPLSPIDLLAKRALDICLSTIVLTVLAPLLLTVAAAIKLDSPGPVLFKQQRCGFNGRRFTIFKFRTMSVLEDGTSIVQATARDPRVTRLGGWLRRTSIDEIPQLLNVLEGSMSIVGPRPHAMAHDNEFNKAVRHYAYRRRVKPGLTGLAQIKGYRGPTPTPDSIEGRVEQDLFYIDNWSFGMDLMILAQTPLELIRGRNAF